MKEKKIEDYIHLYLGCEVFGTYNDASGSRGYLTGITNGGTECEIQFILEDGINVDEEPVFNTIDEIKLLLRPLSSMTEEEAIELFEVVFPLKTLFPKAEYDNIENIWTATTRIPFGQKVAIQLEYGSAKQFTWLLSKHFDLFGLIESGLALDKTLVKN